MTWRASVITLFPELFPGPLGASILGRGLNEGRWALETEALRDHGLGKHRQVDDTPAGGGAGLVLRADVLSSAINTISPIDDPRPRLLMSARGVPVTQSMVRNWSKGPGLVVVCGRFEGVDERVIETCNLTEVSLADIVLAGGEVAAMAMIEACVRLIPGVMGGAESETEESFENGLLEYPQYTRPQTFEGADIPSVLTSGNHGKVGEWRLQESKKLTKERRPDLWEAYQEPKP